MSHSLHSDNDENLRRASLLNVCLEDSLTSNDGLGDLHILRCIIPLEENKIGLLPWSQPALPSSDPAGSGRIDRRHRDRVAQRESSRAYGVAYGTIHP